MTTTIIAVTALILALIAILISRTHGHACDTSKLPSTESIHSEEEVMILSLGKTAWPYQQHVHVLARFYKEAVELDQAGFTVVHHNNGPGSKVEITKGDFYRSAFVSPSYPDHRVTLYVEELEPTTIEKLQAKVDADKAEAEA